MDRSVIIYSAIIRDYIILVDCESSEYELEISSALLSYLKSLKNHKEPGQFSNKIKDVVYRIILADDGFAICGAFGLSYNDTCAFEFLTEVRDNFFENKDLLRHGRLGLSSLVSSSFGNTLKTLTQKWSILPANSSANSSRLNVLRSQVEDVRGIMTDNVERVLERGDRLEDLLEKSEDLESSSSQFRNSAKKVQQKLCLKNLKWTIICAITILIVIVVIILLVLYETGVFNHSSSATTTPKPP